MPGAPASRNASVVGRAPVRWLPWLAATVVLSLVGGLGGWLLVRSSEHGAVVLGPNGTNYIGEQRVEGEDPLAHFSPTAARHLLRTDGFAHVADIMIGSFYDPNLDEGCAFEELISFHGGLGGPQTRAFILHPAHLPLPDEPLLGAAAVHGVLSGWRAALQPAPAQALVSPSA